MPDYTTQLNPIEGWMADNHLLWLEEKARKYDTILEMGCWKGRLTWQLLKTGKKITVVDTFKGSLDEESGEMAMGMNIYDIFMKNVGHNKNLTVFPMDSIEAASQIPDKSIDMIFIDGKHDYQNVKKDIAAWLPKCKKFICGHDYYWPGVASAVQEMVGDHKTFTEIWYKEL